MNLVLSTHLFVNDVLDHNIINLIKGYFNNIELWGMIPHFNYLDMEWVYNMSGFIKEAGIKVPSFHAPIYKDVSDAKDGIWLSLSDPEEYKRTEALNRTKSVIDIMEIFNASIVVIHPGGENSPVENLYKSIDELISYCSGKGIKIALENGITNFSKAENVFNIVKRFPEEYVGICLDIGHANIIGDPIQSIYICKDRLLTMHVSDNNGKEDYHFLPFQGDISWIAISKALKEIDYKGSFVYELRKYDSPYKDILINVKEKHKEIWR